MHCTHCRKHHEFCAGCKAISRKPVESDFWICCRCLNLNYYDKAEREAYLKKWNWYKYHSVFEPEFIYFESE